MPLFEHSKRSSRPQARSPHRYACVPQIHGRTTAKRLVGSHGLKNKSEESVAALLDAENILWKYEPTLFPTGLTGRRLGAIRPDFELPDKGIYIEVTQGARSLENMKRTKIAGAELQHPGVRILLIGQWELKKLDGGMKITRLITELLKVPSQSGTKIAV